MERDRFWFMLGGVVWGAVIGFTLAWAADHRPGGGVTAGPTAQTPAGPMAPTQTGSGGPAAGPGSGSGGGAPMMAEIAALKDRLAENPGDIAVAVRLGDLYYDVGMWPQSVEYYQRAVDAGVSDPAVFTDLGIALQQLGRYDDALVFFDRAQQVAPGHWQSLFNTVVVAGLDLGRFDLADEAIARLETMNPPPPRLDELKAEVERRRAAAGSGP